MPRTSTLLAFPTWRDPWATLEDVPKRLTLADEALQRRMGGNRGIPRWEPSEDDAQALAWGIRALRAWAQGEPPADAAKRMAQSGHAAVNVPALEEEADVSRSSSVTENHMGHRHMPFDR